MVKEGARCVPKPAAPWLHGAFHTTRSAFTAAAKLRMVAGVPLWIAAECPAPDMRIRARDVEIPAWTCGTRTKPSTGQSFSLDKGSSIPTRSIGVRMTLVEDGTLRPTRAAI